jgi:hypothetical protein
MTDLARFGLALIGCAAAVIVIGTIIGVAGKALTKR